VTEDRAVRGPKRPLAVGGALALASALAFGATTPLVQRFGRGVGPFVTAGLLYAGAALVSALAIHGTEAPLRRRDAPRLVATAILGAVLAPSALAWGLQRTSGVTATLLLNLEALFTTVLAVVLWAEPIGTRMGGALAAMVCGGAVLVTGGRAPSLDAWWGPAAVVVATLAWAGDNAVARPLADRDPARVVLAKATIGALASFALSRVDEEGRPPASAVAALTLCGAVGYGASLRLYLRAQRAIGAARTASLFASAPFVGAAIAWAMGERAPAVPTALAVSLCAVGVWLHLTEEHGHAHSHEGLAHTHAHRHDDGHHTHGHDALPDVEHSHPHVHAPMTHTHPHGLDEHHRHKH